VPLSVQRAIKQQVRPLIAYVPTRVPAGWHYVGWAHRRQAPLVLSIGFGWRRNRAPDIGFNVDGYGCDREVHPMKTFHFNGFKVFWSITYEDASAWRPARSGGRRLCFVASAPGYGSSDGPSALALARVIGSAQPIR
jgi:hypothetical protein